MNDTEKRILYLKVFHQYLMTENRIRKIKGLQVTDSSMQTALKTYELPFSQLPEGYC